MAPMCGTWRIFLKILQIVWQWKPFSIGCIRQATCFDWAWFSIMEAEFNIADIHIKKHGENVIAHWRRSLQIYWENCKQLHSKDYEKLKEVVISSHEKPKSEMLDKLMPSSKITGRPSSYPNELISLTSRIGIGEDIVRRKFIQAFPLSIKIWKQIALEKW